MYLCSTKYDKYRILFYDFRWITGKKSLTLNTVVGILMDVKDTGDWVYAFANNLPRKSFALDSDSYFSSKNQS